MVAILIAIAVSSGGLQAADKEKMHDGVLMKDGAMMVMKDGTSMKMEEDMTMSDGTKVMKDGNVMMQNGKTVMLKDNQMVSMDGKVHMMPAGKMMHDGVLMKDGAMMVVKDGISMKMEEDMTMSDGTKVMKDGRVTMHNGKTLMLKDNQMVSMDGKVHMMPGGKRMRDQVTNSDTNITYNADNTRRNIRDRNTNTLTPLDQGNSQADIDTTAQIRKGIIAVDGMSVNAKNVKIITANGQVTLRGPVATSDEKRHIGEIAKDIAGADNVNNQLEVKSTTDDSK